ncbi:hypothetical protein MSAN_01891200 [Mycena sanguinolenta]|uniref:Uncharacterized protein n=1 Tax=Mycena sanguinolenta TaxID=230812 RepID=A0A8H6XNR7_9AGAR|nr:hypothetical protein MSAN_01891200 [Mycena sanguinolenta]
MAATSKMRALRVHDPDPIASMRCPRGHLSGSPLLRAIESAGGGDSETKVVRVGGEGGRPYGRRGRGRNVRGGGGVRDAESEAEGSVRLKSIQEVLIRGRGSFCALPSLSRPMLPLQHYGLDTSGGMPTFRSPRSKIVLRLPNAVLGVVRVPTAVVDLATILRYRRRSQPSLRRMVVALYRACRPLLRPTTPAVASHSTRAIGADDDVGGMWADGGWWA